MKTTELTTNPPASEALGMEASALKDRDGVCMGAQLTLTYTKEQMYTVMCKLHSRGIPEKCPCR